MGYKRILSPADPATGPLLIRALTGLGMAFAVEPLMHANIEDSVIGASVAGMEDDDLRVLGLLVAWLDAHQQRLNVDRITRLASQLPERTRTFWGAQAKRFEKDRRWARLSAQSMSTSRSKPLPPVELLRTGNAFQIRRRGEDPRFTGTRLLVPAGILRERKGDILSPAQVAKIHRTYHHRVLIGPSYRADAWAELVADPTLAPATLARRTYSSFATAWQVRQDFATLRG